MKVTNMNKGRGEGNYAPQIRESIPTAKSERVHNRQTFLTALVAAAAAGRSGANNAFASFRSRLYREGRSAGHSSFPSVTALLSESEIGSRETKRNEI